MVSAMLPGAAIVVGASAVGAGMSSTEAGLLRPKNLVTPSRTPAWADRGAEIAKAVASGRIQVRKFGIDSTPALLARRYRCGDFPIGGIVGHAVLVAPNPFSPCGP